MPDNPRPRVSVILPCYNAEAFVAEALESLVAQTFRDFEVLALDDGSEDGTLAILERYAARDERIRALRMDSLQSLEDTELPTFLRRPVAPR